MRGLFLLLLLLIVAAFPSAAAEVRRPTDDDEVLTRLPRVLRLAGDRLAGWRTRLSADPRDLEAAVGLASDSMQIAVREDDPRFLGHAQAALRPWWEQPDPPAAVLRLRSKIREREHDHAGALADLKRLLAAEPDDPGALAGVANLSYVSGDYAAAAEAIDRLEAAGHARVARMAAMPLRVATGDAAGARRDADGLLADLAATPAVRAFADAVGADAARALGDHADAERRFRAGLDREPGDAYLLRAWADFLLDRGRPAEAVAATQDRLSDSGLLLRHALAAQAAGDADTARGSASRLADRFEEIRLRGGVPHGRFETRHLLAFGSSPEEALRVALANWTNQKQSRDSRGVLEAALAADRPAAAEPVLRFLREAGTEDADLAPLILRLEQGP